MLPLLVLRPVSPDDSENDAEAAASAENAPDRDAPSCDDTCSGAAAVRNAAATAARRSSLYGTDARDLAASTCAEAGGYAGSIESREGGESPKVTLPLPPPGCDADGLNQSASPIPLEEGGTKPGNDRARDRAKVNGTENGPSETDELRWLIAGGGRMSSNPHVIPPPSEGCWEPYDVMAADRKGSDPAR
jgi:hypothetical protein